MTVLTSIRKDGYFSMNFCMNNTLLSTIHFKLYRDKEKTSTNRSHTVWQHDEDCLYQPKHELM